MADHDPIATFATSIEHRMQDELDLKPDDRFDNLLELKNLAGESTGYVRAYTDERIEKACTMSIGVGPGMRYFNIHIVPDAAYDVPRYSFEGMLSTKGSQISMDLYPDFDMVRHIDRLLDTYAGIDRIYTRAVTEDRLPLRPSRLPHMRALCSPWFLLVNPASPEQLPVLKRYANAYFDEWLGMLRRAPRVAPADADERRMIREMITRTIVGRDPDRNLVVEVFGEETVQAIEAAAMA